MEIPPPLPAGDAAAERAMVAMNDLSPRRVRFGFTGKEKKRKDQRPTNERRLVFSKKNLHFSSYLLRMCHRFFPLYHAF